MCTTAILAFQALERVAEKYMSEFCNSEATLSNKNILESKYKMVSECQISQVYIHLFTCLKRQNGRGWHILGKFDILRPLPTLILKNFCFWKWPQNCKIPMFSFPPPVRISKMRKGPSRPHIWEIWNSDTTSYPDTKNFLLVKVASELQYSNV